MSLVKPIVAFRYSPTLHINHSHSSQTSNFINIFEHRSFFGRRTCLKCLNISRRIVKQDDKNRRNFVVYASGDPPTSKKPFSILKWIIKVVLTIILPLISQRWSSLFKLTSGVETAVETIRAVSGGVEKVAGGVEKASEHIADDLPLDAKSKNTAVLVEHAAENVSKGAHLVEDFMHKVE